MFIILQLLWVRSPGTPFIGLASSGSPTTSVKVTARTASSSERLTGKYLLLRSHGCWQDSISCRFLDSVTCHVDVLHIAC